MYVFAHTGANPGVVDRALGSSLFENFLRVKKKKGGNERECDAVRAVRCRRTKMRPLASKGPEDHKSLSSCVKEGDAHDHDAQ